VVLIEMAATGMPVISTMHCDIPNWSKRITGLLPRNVTRMACLPDEVAGRSF